jgi:hypothetical protein
MLSETLLVEQELFTKYSRGPYLLNFQNATVHLEKIFENSANQNPVLPFNKPA